MGRTVASYKKHQKKLPKGKHREEILPYKKFISLVKRRANQYRTGVMSGKILVNKYIKKQIERSEADKKRSDIYFNQKAVDRVYKFFSFLFIPIKGRPEQFKLTPYQAWIVSEVFGWHRKKDDMRKYRYLLLYTARKSGKTMFTVAILMYISYYDYEYDSETYLLATTREQAGQGLKYFKGIVKNSPIIKKRSKINQFQITHEVNGDAIIKSLAAKPETLDGLNPNGAIIDEMHAHNDLELYNVIKSGILSRFNPLVIITSTAGTDKEKPFYKMLERAKAVLDGELQNDSMFYALYELDEDDDIEDVTKWSKANPNLGVTIPDNALSMEWEQAKDSIIERHNFITKNLNMYQDSLDQWISDADYKNCFKSFNEKEMYGWKAWGGIDLASTRDFASLVWVLQDPNTEQFYVVPEFYFPNNDKNKLRTSGVDIQQWIDKKWVIQHKTRTINYDAVKSRIEYYSNIFDVQTIDYDTWNSSMLIQTVELDLDIKCEVAPQNTSYFNFPLKFLEKLILDERITMGKNPVLRWMFRNIVLWQDGNGNVKIAKNKSHDSVDGAVALSMAIAGWLRDNFNFEGEFLEQWNKTFEEKIEEENEII